MLRYAYAFQLGCGPEATHRETAPSANVLQDLGEQGNLGGSYLLPHLLQPDLHQLHQKILLLHSDSLTLLVSELEV